MSFGIDGVAAPYFYAASPTAQGTANTQDPVAYGGGTQGNDKAQANKQDKAKAPTGECRTCAARQYKDGSNDPGVSFKSATTVRPEMAATAVMAHEQEHVTRNKAKAAEEGKEIVAQSVTLHLGICPECHRPYVAGGTTRTTTANAKAQYKANIPGSGADAKGALGFSARA